MYRKYQNSLVQASHLEDLLLFLVFNQFSDKHKLFDSIILPPQNVGCAFFATC